MIPLACILCGVAFEARPQMVSREQHLTGRRSDIPPDATNVRAPDRPGLFWQWVEGERRVGRVKACCDGCRAKGKERL